jgi:hypothetical protein
MNKAILFIYYHFNVFITCKTGKFNLQKLYERIGFNKEILSKGRYAELNAADQRPLR